LRVKSILQLSNSTVLDLRVKVIQYTNTTKKKLTFWYIHHLNQDPIIVLTWKRDLSNKPRIYHSSSVNHSKRVTPF